MAIVFINCYGIVFKSELFKIWIQKMLERSLSNFSGKDICVRSSEMICARDLRRSHAQASGVSWQSQLCVVSSITTTGV